jgi:oligosaccharyltransferase complex subunit gamma
MRGHKKVTVALEALKILWQVQLTAFSIRKSLYTSTTMKYTLPIFLLSFLPSCLAALKSQKQQLADLSVAGKGVINLDSNTFDLLTSPNRDWSVSVLLTALDKKRRCLPCKLVRLTFIPLATNRLTNREFDPSWNAVAKAWATVPKEHKDTHFFATLDFDSGPTVFQKVDGS